jgi:membrane-bound metal-dependent hydrolase YbcI (DUF457 family)
MPDLLTHTLFVYPAKKWLPEKIIFLLIGAILPDILGRTLGVFISDSTIVGWYQVAIHTPMCLALFVYSLSFFFPQKERKTVFLFIILGAASHLFLDLFQKTTTFGYLWLFPFSFSSFNIPLFWPDESIFLIPMFILINILLFWSCL